MFSNEEIKIILEKLEQNGYNTVKCDYINGKYNGSHKKIVENWLKDKEDEKETEYKTYTLETAEEANRIARSSRNSSWIAIIISAMAIIISLFKN